MISEIVLKHQFVEFIPEDLEQGTIYVSMRFATATHLCVCGCGNKVVTPIRPTDWTLIFDGKTVSFDPSIGNWSFPCRSHYFIRKSRVKWAPKWSREEVERGRLHDKIAMEEYCGAGTSTTNNPAETESKTIRPALPKKGLRQILKQWFS